MAKVKKKTKAEELAEAVELAVGAGEPGNIEVVDFSDPNREKSCLEIDFPILPINQVSNIEGNAGKPIYQMSKWWARRRSSVFRSMLIAAAAKAPVETSDAASFVWGNYYKNHQGNAALRKLKVADIFMGGGTTIVEGVRLGMQMVGNDLNPIAWLIVKNETANVTVSEIEETLERVQSDVKPLVMPFYACDCPRGHKGEWISKATGKQDDKDFDPFSLSWDERKNYEYVGPEIIYAFWSKHGPCLGTECNHRTPILTSPVVAIKKLTVKTWANFQCKECDCKFDLEQREARMAPSALFVRAETEKPYSTMDLNGNFQCPNCSAKFQDQKAAADGKSSSLGKSKNKKLEFSLLVHPDWMRGVGAEVDGKELGGSVTDSAEATSRWNQIRSESLKLIEVRGKLPEFIHCPDTKEKLFTDKRGGTVPARSSFKCQEPTCGRESDILSAIKVSGKSGPVSPYAIQGYCPNCDQEKQPYGGRFFDVPNFKCFDAAQVEWHESKESVLKDSWPRSELPYGFMTHHLNGGIPNHGFTHWWTLYNPRQLLVHAHLVNSLRDELSRNNSAAEFVIGSFQQYLRNQSMLSFWHLKADKLAPALSNSNFHPKSTVVEVGFFPPMGYGPWSSTTKPLLTTAEWKNDPWELVTVDEIAHRDSELADRISGLSTKVFPKDSVLDIAELHCGSSTQLSAVEDQSIDLVITDPPFGGLVHYSELSDFFYVWLRLLLKDRYPDQFSSEYTPKALEAVANKARQNDDADDFYKRLLTECWAESNRMLKPGGLLAFTFHHSEDKPWVAVLESLFDAGFYLEATYPIRSDETKGEGEFGSRKVEYDIIHVCRKRLEEPTPISWARLRRRILKDVQQLQDILEQHQKAGLGAADLQVIRRGKALEYFSRHYGKVYIERGREDEFTVTDALVGINQLLEDDDGLSTAVPPVNAEPYTRQFLRLFFEKENLARDQMQKFLRGTGVSPDNFADRGWCNEVSKVFHLTPPLEWANDWKGKPRKSMSRDFDQTYFLIGACYEDSGIKVSDTLNSGSFVPHPAIGDLLNWFVLHGADQEMKDAADRARSIYKSWEAKNTKTVESQKSLFDLDGDE